MITVIFCGEFFVIDTKSCGPFLLVEQNYRCPWALKHFNDPRSSYQLSSFLPLITLLLPPSSDTAYLEVYLH